MRKKRNESFFGMHFDFHAGKNSAGLGSNNDPELLDRMLKEVKPDYVQCDTKGHAGVTSYPTKVGYPAPEMKGDILKMWREVTAQNDVALYAHHSGVWDNEAVEHHPEWAQVNDKGERSAEKASVFGGYADGLLIPQLVEMANEYGLDGAWVDGECWAVQIDYSEMAKKAWFEKTGREAPLPDEDGYEEYKEFNREGFKKYVEHYVTEVKKRAPDFQIASNWLYASEVPEEKKIPVDFISGDYAPQNSVNTARFQAYMLENQPQPWDLMAWGFNYKKDRPRCTKTAAQLCQEAAVVISVGGGFQVYNGQLLGTVQSWAIPIWAELARFCRARQALCHKARPVRDTAIIHSTMGFYYKKNRMFGKSGRLMPSVTGNLLSLLDSQYTAEILMTHHVKDDLAGYGMVIVPNTAVLEGELFDTLVRFAENGGVLVVTGDESVALFEKQLGIRCGELPAEETSFYVESRGKYGVVRQKNRSAEACGAKIVKYARLNGDGQEQPEIPVVFENALGKGKIIGVTFDMGRAYSDDKSAALEDFCADIYANHKKPKARVYGSRLVSAALMEKDGEYRLNLLNLGGEHANEKVRSFDEIPPLFGLTAEVRCATRPVKVTYQPENIPLDYEYDGEKVTVRLPRLDIHSVVTIKLPEEKK